MDILRLEGLLMGFRAFTWGHAVMMAIGGGLIWLADLYSVHY